MKIIQAFIIVIATGIGLGFLLTFCSPPKRSPQQFDAYLEKLMAEPYTADQMKGEQPEQ